MKLFRQGIPYPQLFAGLVFLAALSTSRLFAQQPVVVPPATPAPAATPGAAVAGPIITEADGWKLTSQNPAPSPASGGAMPSIDSQAIQVVLRAAPTDEKRDIPLSVYCFRFHINEPPLTDDAGIDAEVGRFEQQVIVQGYSPSQVMVRHLSSAKNLPILAIDVYAKNTAGEMRVFTDAMMVAQVAEGTNNYRLYASCPGVDIRGEADIYVMIKSLDVPVSNILVNPTAATNTATTAGSTSDAGKTAAQSAQIVQDYHGALVIVEGKKGLGSGFLCNMGGHTYIVTNAHVLADNTNIKLTNLDGVNFTSGSSGVAVGHDVVKMEVGAMPKTFEVMENLDSTVKIGDAVMIPGNAEGAKVVTAETGRIVGIGPNLIEVDAPFVPGNSGSPIIHIATGKVLGVATYMLIKSVDKQEGKKVVESIRRFGYRLDSIKEWQPINWQVFYAESAQVSAIEDLSNDFIRMFNDAEHFGPEDCKNPILAREVREFIEAQNKGKTVMLSKADRDSLRKDFFSQLRATTQGDINLFNTRPAYDYFHREVEKQGELRTELFDIFTRILGE